MKKDDLVSPIYWKKLSEADPQDVCRRSWAAYDPERGYLLFFTSDQMLCNPAEKKVAKVDSAGEQDVEPQLSLLIVHYLINADETVPTGRMVTEKELPGGSLFFQGPHKLPLEHIARHFSGSPGALLKAGLSMGGVRTDYGDASFELRVLPKIKMGVIFYDGDEEFPPRCVITFEASIGRHLALDAIWAMSNVISSRLIGRT